MESDGALRDHIRKVARQRTHFERLLVVDEIYYLGLVMALGIV